MFSFVLLQSCLIMKAWEKRNECNELIDGQNNQIWLKEKRKIIEWDAERESLNTMNCFNKNINQQALAQARFSPIPNASNSVSWTMNTELSLSQNSMEIILPLDTYWSMKSDFVCGFFFLISHQSTSNSWNDFESFSIIEKSFLMCQNLWFVFIVYNLLYEMQSILVHLLIFILNEFSHALHSNASVH